MLTLAGVSALTAAIVPQPRPTDLCAGPANLPLDFDDHAKAAMLPNVWAVAIALGLGYLVIWSVMLIQWRHGRPPRKRRPGRNSVAVRFRLIMVLGLIGLTFFPDTFKECAHGTAAGSAALPPSSPPRSAPRTSSGARTRRSQRISAVISASLGVPGHMRRSSITVLWVHQTRGLGGHWGLWAEVALMGESPHVLGHSDGWTCGRRPDRIMRLPEGTCTCVVRAGRGRKANLPSATCGGDV